MTIYLKIKLAMRALAMIPEVWKAVEPGIRASVAMHRAAEAMNKAADLEEELEKQSENN